MFENTQTKIYYEGLRCSSVFHIIYFNTYLIFLFWGYLISLFLSAVRYLCFQVRIYGNCQQFYRWERTWVTKELRMEQLLLIQNIRFQTSWNSWNIAYASLKLTDTPQARIGSFLSLTHCYQMFRPTRYCKSPKQTHYWPEMSHCVKALDVLAWAADFERWHWHRGRSRRLTPQGSLMTLTCVLLHNTTHVYTHIIRLNNKYN